MTLRAAVLRTGSPPAAHLQEPEMTRTLFRAIALAAALITTPAAAADLYYGKAPAFAAAPFNGYNWNRAYVGVNLGYQWGKVTNWDGGESNGVMGGGQIGYNWQFNQFVLGLEADLQGSAAEGTFAAYKFANPWFGTVRGRAGYAMNNVLLYLTGGLAYGAGRVEFAGASETQTHLGWALGGGGEGGLTPNWSARAGYLYVRLDDPSYLPTGGNNGL